jgi:hypothetical protein
MAFGAGLGIAAVASAQPAQLPAPARPPGTKTVQTPAKDLPSARSIIDKHISAIGGREAILSNTSVRATGTLAIPAAGMTGTVEIVGAKPNKVALKITISGVGEVLEGFNGTSAWSVSPMTGPMLLDGEQLEEKKFDADFYSELHEEGRYKAMETVEKTVFEGRPAYKVRLLKKSGAEDFEFYDVETGLKAGSITTRTTPMGSVTGTTIETDYRKFGKLLTATTVKQTTMGVQQVITVTNIEYGNVPDAAFDPPPAIKGLIK